MCNDKVDNQVKNGDFDGVGESGWRRAGRAGGGALEPQGAGRGGAGGGRGWTPVEKAQAAADVYAFPEFGRSYRSVPEGGEEVVNGQWSRLRGLIDWDAVERARKADERAAERERERMGAKRRAGGWTWLVISKAEDAQ